MERLTIRKIAPARGDMDVAMFLVDGKPVALGVVRDTCNRGCCDDYFFRWLSAPPYASHPRVAVGETQHAQDYAELHKKLMRTA